MDAMYEFGADPLWDEWGAALYESYAADNEGIRGGYHLIAHNLCEELEYGIYDALDAEIHYTI